MKLHGLELYDIAGIYAVAAYYSEGESFDTYQNEDSILKDCGIGIVTIDRNSRNGGDLEVIRHYDNALEDIERCQLEIEDWEHDLLEDSSIDNINGHANAVLDKAKAEFDLKNDYAVVGGTDEDHLICDLETFRRVTGNQMVGAKLESHLESTLTNFMAYGNGEVVSVIVQEQDPGFDWEGFAEDPIFNSENGSTVVPVSYVLERNLPEQLADWGLIPPLGKHHKATEVNL